MNSEQTGSNIATNDAGAVVMLAGEGPSARMIYNGLKHHFPIARVIIEKRAGRRAFLRRRVRRLGWRKVVGQILFVAIVIPYLRLASRSRMNEITSSHSLDSSPIDQAIVRYVPAANDATTVQLLQELNPKIVIVNGTSILSPVLLASVPATFINAHAGITPMYRGVHGAYWALADGAPHACGVTVHLVDAGIDTGGILEQALIRPTARDNFVTYPLLQTAAALPLLQQVIRRGLTGSLLVQPNPEGKSALRSHPTLLEYFWRCARDCVK